VRTKFLGMSVDLLSLSEVRGKAMSAVESRHGILHCSLNALKVVEARKDPQLRQLLEHFDLITPDGMSVVWGLKLLGQRSIQRVAGVDVMTHLLQEGAARKWRFFFLGAGPEVSGTLKGRVECLFPGVQVAGTRHGFFPTSEESGVVEQIRDSGADVLFVGMPSPRKERFLLDHRQSLGVPFAMGVGGGLDLLSGRTSRAPLWMRRVGLEWTYRVMQEPRRLAGRYLTSNPRFAAMLAGDILAGRRSRGVTPC